MDERDLGSPILTFDDGHASNYRVGLWLAERRCSADFFINPAHIGKAHYMTWSQLRELKQYGHSIQSHGLDHRFLSECDTLELQQQLHDSKQRIEQEISATVTLLAPPGGRYDHRCITLARAAGYRAIACSAPGKWHSFDQYLIPRIAVMNHLVPVSLLHIQQGNSPLLRKMKTKYLLTGFAKKMLGDSRYDRLRNRLMS
jgi:peptidoglycan/xylan/chitin deacetylase (PgdA/CDA1 family)